ncbi:hypothetical protein F511_30191 [Dorcoceras hygrometricum]|uniref:Uncharacterized protein n=1 Tax=Dorcoceras hygrometricum TaxID=472368 RepID=A0A2Z7CJ66_9LAMI|nr:hypothetical protein F511_30191 [Dorcoceras hygrometricum]
MHDAPTTSRYSTPSAAQLRPPMAGAPLAGPPPHPAVPVQARRRKTHVYVVSHTVEAVVYLWSLGVLTAAGCGIGSVHAVVRSNLLVEPSKVEEGEM